MAPGSRVGNLQNQTFTWRCISAKNTWEYVLSFHAMITTFIVCKNEQEDIYIKLVKM